jgi:hypothetical protein
MDKDSWNSSASGGGGQQQVPISAKSFHAGVAVDPCSNINNTGGGMLASLASLVTSTNGVINHGSSARLVSRDPRNNNKLNPNTLNRKENNEDQQSGVLRCHFARENFVKSGTGGGSAGMAMSLMAHFGGAHQQYSTRRPDWLARMNGSTLTDASSLAFEDNDYQWCSEYAR